MNVSDFRDAIAQMVLAETGLPTGKVFWARQGAARPVRPFIELDAPEGLGPVEQAEQRYRVNASPTADTVAVATVEQAGTDLAGTITTVAAGVLANHSLLITVTPGAGPFPNATFNPTGGSEGEGQLVINCGDGADVTPADVNTLINSGPLAAQFTAALTGSDPFEAGLFTNFVGGTNGTDAFLIDNVTHPDVTVQLIAMSNKAAGPSDAMTLLQNLSRRLDTLRVTDRLDALGLSIIRRGTIQNISLELQNEYEGRAVMAVTIRMADSITESVDRFDSTKVEIDIDQDDGNPPVTTTIILP